MSSPWRFPWSGKEGDWYTPDSKGSHTVPVKGRVWEDLEGSRMSKSRFEESDQTFREVPPWGLLEVSE